MASLMPSMYNPKGLVRPMIVTLPFEEAVPTVLGEPVIGSFNCLASFSLIKSEKRFPESINILTRKDLNCNLALTKPTGVSVPLVSRSSLIWEMYVTKEFSFLWSSLKKN